MGIITENTMYFNIGLDEVDALISKEKQKQGLSFVIIGANQQKIVIIIQVDLSK